MLTDEKLYSLCATYGAQALEARQKFIGLLPEVAKRKLYEKKGFDSIFEFAFKLCGLTEEQVRIVLNLEKNFSDKPILKKLLVNGEVSINKLVRIQSFAIKENQEYLAEKVQVLSKSALETFIRDEKQNALPQALFEVKSLPGQTFKLGDDVKQELEELHQKGININNLLRGFLEKRKQEIEEEKENLAKKTEQTKSRYIKSATKNVIKKEFGTKCAIPNCKKASEQIHHTDRFSLSHQHNQYFLAPLCKNHHQIAHSIDLKFQEKRTQDIFYG